MNNNNVEGFFQAMFQDSVIVFSKGIQERVFPWNDSYQLLHILVFEQGSSVIWAGFIILVRFLFFGANHVQEPQVGANILRGVEISKIFFFFFVASSIYLCQLMFIDLFW